MSAATEPERYSHPAEDGHDAVLLMDHLQDVADRTGYVTPDGSTTPAGDPLGDVLRTVALVHDAGKASTWFQQHIGMSSGTPPDSIHTHHSLFGAFLAAYALDQRGYSDETILAGTLAVLRHHGVLGDGPELLFTRSSPGRNKRLADQRAAAVDQVEDIDETVPNVAARIVERATDGAGTWTDYAAEVRSGTAFGRIRDRLSYAGVVRTLSRDLVTETLYETEIQIWSALVLCDKTDAAGAPDDPAMYEGDRVTFETIDDYINTLQEDGPNDGSKGKLNDWRNTAREQVLDTVRSERPTVSTLTLPTGLGKTLTGVSAAALLCEITDRDRIIYALPFTSIIDQVGDELTTVFDSDGHDGRVLLHHHLSDATVTLDEDAEFEDTDAIAAIEGMLGESWRASVVVSTFVQLFESLAGPRNVQSMKLPALHDSVIVLDEPQSLPHSWWPLVRRLVDILTERYNAAVIAMTATQPRLFDGETTELVGTPERFYHNIDRTTFEIDPSIRGFREPDSAVTFESAADRLTVSSDGSALAVCNTISSAETLYERVIDKSTASAVGAVLDTELREGKNPDPAALADAIEGDGGRPVAFLSTRVRPRDRLLLIKTLKELTSRGSPVLCVSTQLIEAGVDISFEQVYRDFAPMDSIVQAAGRCNRSYDGETGTVTVWWLRGDPDTSITPGEAVYNTWGESLLSITAESLQTVAGDKGSIAESALTWDAVNEYYDNVAEANPGNRDLVTYLDAARADELARASLIEERAAVEVIVCRTDTDRETVERASNAFVTGDFDAFDDHIDSLRDRQVSIPVYPDDAETAKKLTELPVLVDNEYTDLKHLDTDNDRYREFFDVTTGLNIPNSTVEARFL